MPRPSPAPDADRDRSQLDRLRLRPRAACPLHRLAAIDRLSGRRLRPCRSGRLRGCDPRRQHHPRPSGASGRAAVAVHRRAQAQARQPGAPRSDWRQSAALLHLQRAGVAGHHADPRQRLARSDAAGHRPVVLQYRAGRQGAGKQARAARLPWSCRDRRADHPGPHRPGGDEPRRRQAAFRLGAAGVPAAAAKTAAVPPARSQRPRGADGAARPDAGTGRRWARLRVCGPEFRARRPRLRRHAGQAQARQRTVQLAVGHQGSVPRGFLPQDRHRRAAGCRRPLVRFRHGLAAATQGGAVLRPVHRLSPACAQRLPQRCQPDQLQRVRSDRGQRGPAAMADATGDHRGAVVHHLGADQPRCPPAVRAPGTAADPLRAQHSPPGRATGVVG